MYYVQENLVDHDDFLVKILETKIESKRKAKKMSPNRA